MKCINLAKFNYIPRNGYVAQNPNTFVQNSWTVLHSLSGCYDGKLYKLDRQSGSIDWTFDTQGQVKCSPEVDPKSGIVFIGSHSHAVYALDIEVILF